MGERGDRHGEAEGEDVARRHHDRIAPHVEARPAQRRPIFEAGIRQRDREQGEKRKRARLRQEPETCEDQCERERDPRRPGHGEVERRAQGRLLRPRERCVEAHRARADPVERHVADEERGREIEGEGPIGRGRQHPGEREREAEIEERVDRVKDACPHEIGLSSLYPLTSVALSEASHLRGPCPLASAKPLRKFQCRHSDRGDDQSPILAGESRMAGKVVAPIHPMSMS